jgi:transposase InsO family protein
LVRYDTETMRDLAILLLHLITITLRLLRPGGVRSIIAESLLVKQQLLIVNRSRQRGPNLTTADRSVTGLCALLMRRTRVVRSAIILKPSTVLAFHRNLVKRKYRLLFSPILRGTPGPKGPSRELINAIVVMKQRNPRWGCPHIAAQISLALGITLDKDVVRRVLARYYRSTPGGNGPSWLTFLGQMRDSLWSIDLFRCESATLKSHWVLLVMDQYTRRIIGFTIHVGIVDGPALCRMSNRAVHDHPTPRFISSDHDPLYRYHRWRANLRIREITEVKTIPYVPLSHPFVERPTTIRPIVGRLPSITPFTPCMATSFY